MSEKTESVRLAPPALRAELERSATDLANGRVAPLRSALSAIHQRASRRSELRREARVEPRAADIA